MRVKERLLEIPVVYDTVLNTIYRSGHRNLFVSDLIDAKSGMRILDVGCGTADILKRLPPVDYVGLDENSNYLNVARTRNRNLGTFMTLDVLGREFSELGKFDRILLLGVLHHLTDTECSGLLSALVTGLKPGGFLVTLDPAFEDDQHPISRVVSRLDRGRYVRHHLKYREMISRSFEIEATYLKRDFLRVPSTTALFRASRSNDS
jgi:SAM-dependent methyltransferase